MKKIAFATFVLLTFTPLFASSRSAEQSNPRVSKTVDKVSVYDVPVSRLRRVAKNIPWMVLSVVNFCLYLFIVVFFNPKDGHSVGRSLLGLGINFTIYLLMISCEIFGEGVGGRVLAKIQIADSKTKKEASWSQKIIRGVVKYPPLFLLGEISNLVFVNYTKRLDTIVIALVLYVIHFIIWPLALGISSLIGKGKGIHGWASKTELLTQSKKEEKGRKRRPIK